MVDFLANGGTDPVPPWLQIAESVGQALGTISVFIAVVALAIQWFSSRKERQQQADDAKTDRERHEAQLAAFRQAEDDRLAAQARRVVPAIFRAHFANPSIWNVTINNWGVDAISGLNVEIVIVDQNGQKVSGGWRLADRVALGEAMMDFFLPEFAKVIDGAKFKFQEFIEAIKAGVISLGENPQAVEQYFANTKLEIDQQTAAVMQQQVNYALTLNFTDEWPDAVAPSRYVAMAVHTTRPEYQVHVKLRYEDAFGYVWERSDTEGPKRIHEPRVS